MDQLKYSELCEIFIREHYPSFIDTLSRKEDNSFDCFIKSNSGEVRLWIATYNIELTIGFENSKGESSWHCHKNSSPIERPNKELNELKFLVDSILNDREKFVHDQERGLIFLDELRENQDKKDFEIYCWSKL